MLSYRHGFHAGNFADVFKHILLFSLLENFKQQKPFTFIDIFSGAGVYSIEDSFMQKNKEYEKGILKLLSFKNNNDLINKYLNLINDLNNKNTFKTYPGSGLIATKLLDKEDNLYFSEMHPNEFKNLETYFKNDKRVTCEKANAYQMLNKVLSNYTGRKLVLIDPSYEIKNEYEKVSKLVSHAYKQFPNEVYMLWYPILPTKNTDTFINSFLKLGIKNLSHIHIKFENSYLRMQGTGFFLINSLDVVNKEVIKSFELVMNFLKEPKSSTAIEMKVY